MTLGPRDLIIYLFTSHSESHQHNFWSFSLVFDHYVDVEKLGISGGGGGW